MIELLKKDIDRSLLRANLRRTPQERLDALASFLRFLDEVREAGRRARRGR